MTERLKSVSVLPPQDIIVGKGRLRPASAAGVGAVKASITELGIIKDPIHVRKVKDGSFVLIAGLHRLTAVSELGWSSVPVVAWRCTNDWARMMEIDDNLAGAELTALDTALFLAERKAVYEKMHPETKAGVAGGLARQNSASDIVSFAETTAEKFGLSQRHIQRLIAVGSALNSDQVRWLREAEKPVTLSDLQAISKIGDDHVRGQVCIALTNGTAKNASDALRQTKKQPGDDARSAADLQVRKLNDAFARASKAAKRQFVADHEAELRDLLGIETEDTGEVVPFKARERASS